MKIGILTHPLSRNYGGVLQNWALQQVLKSMGHEPVTIYWGQKNVMWPEYFRCILSWSLHRFVGPKFDFPHSPKWKNPQTAGIRCFVESKINLTESLYKKDILNQAEKKFDSLIVGSDQVWRPRYINPIEMMFLPYKKKYGMKKIAYAASFGTNQCEFTPVQLTNCKKLIADFDAVSVREKDGVKQCAEYFGRENVELVLDPTLLVNKEDYMKLCEDVIADSSGYVFAYILDENESLVAKGKDLAERLGVAFKLVSADSTISPEDTIEKWLSCFRDAVYIITDSFHGTVFSLIFQKPFATIYNEKRGTARIDNLVSLFPDVSKRIVSIDDSLPEMNIHLKNFTGNLHKSQASSLQFLKNALSE